MPSEPKKPGPSSSRETASAEAHPSTSFPLPPIKSGLPFGTGSPRTTGSLTGPGNEWWGAFTIGEGVDRPGAIPFQLAPRLYVLSRGKAGLNEGRGKARAHVPYDELPQHLIFRESPAESGEQTLQSWVSEEGANWTWELIVERLGETIQATLSATPSAGVGKGDRLVWKSRGGWEAFGKNDLTPEPGAIDVTTLIVAVP